MWSVTLRGLAAHKVRMALAAVSVVLGIAFVSGTLVLTDTIAHSVDSLRQQVSGGSDVTVRAKSVPGANAADREPVPAAVLSAVKSVQGVAAAAGSSAGFAQLVDEAGSLVDTGGRTVGMAMPPRELGFMTIREGRGPARTGEVAIDVATADRSGLSVGDRLTVQLAGPAMRARIVGLIGVGGADGLPGTGIVTLDPASAATAFGRPGFYSTVEVAAVDDVTASSLRKRIAAVLPPSYEAVTGQRIADENAAAMGKALRFLPTALLAFAGISLFVGAFLIVNTFSMLVRQRMREFGLLRAIGASRRQVMAAVLAEAVIVGVLASAAGFAVGVATAHGLEWLLAAAGVELPATPLQVKPRTAVLSLFVGTVVTVVAAAVPAIRAGRVPAMAAILGLMTSGRRQRRYRTILAAGSLAAGALLVSWGLGSPVEDALRLIGLGALLAFVGVAGLAQYAVRPLVAAIGRPLTSRLGVPGRMGRDNAARNPQRTAATAGALAIGLALVVLTSVFAASAKVSLARALDAGQRADFLVGSEQYTPFSPELTRSLAQRPEFDAVVGLRGGHAEVGGAPADLLAADPDGLEKALDLDLVAGGTDALRNGGLLVHRDIAAKRHWEVGDAVPVRFARTGMQTVPVVGIFAEKRLLGTDFLLSMRDFERGFVEQLDVVALVNADPRASAKAVQAAFATVLADYPQLHAQTKADVQKVQDRQLDQALALITALLGLALLIACLGIMNTLALAVYERTRELGLVRALGMSRRQLRASVRIEAVLVAVLGGMLGVLVGVGAGATLVHILRDKGLTDLSLPGQHLVLYVVGAALAGLLAAAWPARRAARLDVLTAIAHE